MLFRTELQTASSPLKIRLGDSVFGLGSCFAEHTGRLLADYKWDVLINPFGTLFDPLSMARALEYISQGKDLEDWGYVQREGIWCHFHLHSRISAQKQEEMIAEFCRARDTARQFLHRASVVTLTLGTALVYELSETGFPVANCHKQPGNQFNLRRMTVDEVAGALNRSAESIRSIAPDSRILVTLSPVRHTRQGFEANALSKATLRLAIEQFVSGSSNRVYFPAYEIMLDDLRDYRFYDRDMVHPAEQAIAYIWEKFQYACVDEQARTFIGHWENVRQALSHRPFHPSGDAYKSFIRQTIRQLEGFKGVVDVTEEIAALSSRLV